uniref:Uncharacterized protein n=1 Tax=Arundo donax TaxID=35708 RepID=A0A0A8Y7C1_ARUDO
MVEESLPGSGGVEGCVVPYLHHPPILLLVARSADRGD